ncbi:pre-mRNA-processing protein 40C isoform X2 [Malania oleifera]|uniref:pre-mRNA-processing protein 40C isoform X2 n=1 Tax=Malania oleifera TaxID=397392 RepID=UPI0025ADE760|nr:pre-mRNA-processing protein 40C isoform X2 [Malania oleifera]
MQVSKSNPSAASVVQPSVPGPSSSPGPSFSYNVSHPGSGFPTQQFQSITPPAPAQSQVIKNMPTSSGAALQPPVPGQPAHPNSFVPRTALPIMPPTKGASSNVPTFSFNGNPQSLQKDQPLKSDTLAVVAQVVATASSGSSLSQSAPLSAQTSSSTTVASISNLGPAISWMPPALSFPGMPGTPGTPGPPGITPSAPVSTHLTVSSAAMDSSSAVLRQNLTASVPSNLAAQQQTCQPYLSLPPVASSSQGPWLQPPPQMSGLPRPPFLTYPAVFPGSFPLLARGMSIPSVPLPDSQTPGVGPVGTTGGIPLSSMDSAHSMVCSSGQQPELPPPGIDNKKQGNDVNYKDGAAVNEQLDAWTAHKTDTGVVYYYNALTGESTYEKPYGFKGEPDKVTVQPTAVSWEKLVGTDWALVTTNDGKKYYHNTKTKLSSWQVPAEVAELRKKQDGDNSKEQSASMPNTNPLIEKGAAPISLSSPAINTGGRDAAAIRTSGGPGSTSALDLIKKKLDSGTPVTSLPVPASSGPVAVELNGSRAVEAIVKGLQSDNSKDKLKDANGDGNMSESSSDSEDADGGPTKEERIMQFKEMLKERGVAPFSKWEKELPKIVFDPRFKAIPGYSARRSLFEHYVKTRAEEERKEKRAAQKAAIEGFKQLLVEASEDVDHTTDYQTFKKKWGNDSRFEALDRKEREFLLNERVLPLKKAAEEKAKAIRAAAASSFKSMLKEKGDITINTRWSRVKDSLRSDSRYKSVKHEDREVLFNEYIAVLKAAADEAEQAAKAKKEEQEKLKERERELRKRKEREEQEMERVRMKVRRKEAVTSYQALLVETIKDPQASWTESKPKLEKDPQRRATNTDLDASDLEKLFREHVKTLHERCVHEFRALLSEVLTAETAARETEDGKTVLTSWSTAKRLLKPDPRYMKMPRKERESLWRRYTVEMQRRLKLAGDQKEEKHMEAKIRSSVDSSRLPSGSRRNDERRYDERR